MSKMREIREFENRFPEDVIEVAAVTGPSGVSAGRPGGDVMWNASIDIIAWKELYSNEPAVKEEFELEWLVADEELEKSQSILEEDTIVRLQVRKAEHSMMLVKVLETEYIDDDLKVILKEAGEPIFYNDDIFGKFELNKGIKIFEREISWAGEEGNLYFDWDQDSNVMKSALETAYTLFNNQDEWSKKIRMYAAEELVELANDWLQDNDEAEIDEITKEMFVNFMTLDSISVYPEGDFEIFFFDGDMFWGHCIIVDGNINGDFNSAQIAG
ncbi:DUF2262 domain-containing protein [Metabacillus fastidiosus]|uniref:DUF2262 domain-containing protein n=1 Tax=Metabacillus fastidiosus TaxID=1458 RepID=UPI002DBA3B6B|nr:DUF2262 domain-containing protein [Metabacillus fastidiosus]MEC2076139.1 DUF2262 domain-containing protein [Metabacillus fastidiosus]